MTERDYDRLEKLMALQRDFHQLVGPPLKGASEAQRELMLADTMRNLIVEAVEVMQEVNYKPWKKGRKAVNWGKVKEELADCFIFLMNGLLEAGMDADDFYSAVIRKEQKNVERQQEDY